MNALELANKYVFEYVVDDLIDKREQAEYCGCFECLLAFNSRLSWVCGSQGSSQYVKNRMPYSPEVDQKFHKDMPKDLIEGGDIQNG